MRLKWRRSEMVSCWNLLKINKYIGLKMLKVKRPKMYTFACQFRSFVEWLPPVRSRYLHPFEITRGANALRTAGLRDPMDDAPRYFWILTLISCFPHVFGERCALLGVPVFQSVAVLWKTLFEASPSGADVMLLLSRRVHSGYWL